MFKLFTTRARVLWVLASMVTFTACANARSPMESTDWKLVEWTLSSISPDAAGITAKFTAGKISGFSGVNSYGSSCTLGAGGAFAIGVLGTSKKMGPEIPMRAEGAYRTLLGQAKSYKVVGRSLTLYDAAGNESLIFESASN